MTGSSQRSPSFRLSKQGFQPLNNPSMGDGTQDIPLQTVVSHTPSQAPTAKEMQSEKTGMFHRGRRRANTNLNIDPRTGAPLPNDDGEEKTALNRMGRIYTKILNFSIVTRYMIYVAPVALCLAIPIILSQTKVITGSIGTSVDQKDFWIWIEIVWLSFWGCKIVAHFLPKIFAFLVGVVSPGIRKYVQLLAAVEKSMSFVFWMIVNQVTFEVLIKNDEKWTDKMRSVLLGLLVCVCIIFGERVLIQLISISYHRKQFDSKIKESKRNIYLLGVLYDASRALFPAYCPEFEQEDYIIQDTIDFGLGSRKTTMKGHARSGSRTPMRLIQDVGRFGDKVTSAFGTVAQEITGKKVFDPNSAHSIVLEALEKNKSCEALAKRIWMSFVVEGKDALYQEDLAEVMGPGREKEAEECFGSLDKDGNGDISLEEMILTVTEFGRERKAITSSMHDVDQAINALDGLLFTIVFVVCIFVIIAFLSPGFTTTLATSATALLSLSFVFAATCQEVLGSCIFLFVKHPYDIGDRVDIATDQLTVEHISLLYTVFKRVNNGKIVQTPNIVLNNLWVENITRSKAMREQVSIFCDFGTSFEDINTLKQELINFVRAPQNSRDFHPDIEVEVLSIAEMNKLELKVDIRHKSNWSNDALRAARRSKFMCALVVALRKVPIAGPGGSDAALGDANKPSWSVAISPEAAQAVRDKYLADKDAARMYPTKKPDDDDDKGKSSGNDYLGVGAEGNAINSLNQRKPGADPIRDDTWNNRDDASTVGRPSMDNRPDIDEVRTLLHKASSGGRRKQAATLSPSASRPSVDQPRQGMPPLPLQVNPSPQAPTFGNNYAPVPQTHSAPRTPASPSSVSTGRIEEFQYQQMMPPPRNQSRAPPAGNAFASSMQQPLQPPRVTQSPPAGSNNPYRSQSPEEKYPYKP